MFLLVMGTKQFRTEVDAYPRAPPSLNGLLLSSPTAAFSLSAAALHNVQSLRKGWISALELISTQVAVSNPFSGHTAGDTEHPSTVSIIRTC